MFAPDSYLVSPHEVVPGKGHLSGSYIPRTTPVRAIVVHTTGAGPAKRLTHDRFATWRRRNPEATKSTFTAALWIYQNMVPGPHYVVGQGGEIAQTAPESECAWHVGSSEARRYRLSGGRWGTDDTAWWFRRWQGLQSPVELAGGHLWDGYDRPKGLSLSRLRARIAARWARGSVNANTIGIEVAPDPDKPAGPWSDNALATLDALLVDLTDRHSIPRRPEHLLGHSDANPLSRSSRGEGWDPNPRQWTFDTFAKRVLA